MANVFICFLPRPGSADKVIEARLIKIFTNCLEYFMSALVRRSAGYYNACGSHITAIHNLPTSLFRIYNTKIRIFATNILSLNKGFLIIDLGKRIN